MPKSPKLPKLRLFREPDHTSCTIVTTSASMRMYVSIYTNNDDRRVASQIAE
jgi:hypothetical protein